MQLTQADGGGGCALLLGLGDVHCQHCDHGLVDVGQHLVDGFVHVFGAQQFLNQGDGGLQLLLFRRLQLLDDLEHELPFFF